jgi:hypothetical protein
LGREHADQAFTQEIKRCEQKLGEIRDKVGGGRRLNGLVSYVAETERAQEERRERRMSGDMEEEQGPMDVYKYSPAQVVDGKSISSRRIPDYISDEQVAMLCYSKTDYHYSKPVLKPSNLEDVAKDHLNRLSAPRRSSLS